MTSHLPVLALLVATACSKVSPPPPDAGTTAREQADVPPAPAPAPALDAAPVTNADYLRCVEAGECRPPAWMDPGSSANLETGKEETANAYRPRAAADRPVVGVSREDARAYCAWRDARLPTDAEWTRGVREGAAQSVEGMLEWVEAGTAISLDARGGRNPTDAGSRLPVLGFRCFSTK